MVIRALDPEDLPYVLSSWRETHKQSPGCDKIPWGYYKHEWGTKIRRVLDDPTTVVLGAYDEKLLGYIVFTPGKRVDTLHWAQVKFDVDGKRQRRAGIMTALLEAADLGKSFVYTMRASRRKVALPDGSTTKSLDEALVYYLRERGITATYVALKEWLA